MTIGTVSKSGISIGTNLSELVYYGTQQPFKDLARLAEWIPQKTQPYGWAYEGWNTGETLDVDNNGWVKSLHTEDSTHKYDTVSAVISLGTNPSKTYVLLYDGEGTIQYSFDGRKNVQMSNMGKDVIDITHAGTETNASIYIRITETNPTNYLRNIRLVALEDQKSYKTDIFNPKFIEKIEPFSTLRFMDWMKTNNSSQKDWSDRPTLKSSTWNNFGAPVEVMVDLANKTNSNPWFTMPHQATDSYIRRFAEYVKNNLKPGLKVYVEYSNEVWNGAFQQGNYAEEQGKKTWTNSGDSDYTKRINWYSKRTTEVVGIWNKVFAGQTDQVIGVMGAQSGNVWTGQQALSYAWQSSNVGGTQKALNSATKTSADYGVKAIAIAPYFGYYLGAPENQTQVEAWTKDSDGGLNKLFNELTTGGVLSGGPAGGALQESYNQIAAYATLAKEKNLQLVAYEGGQHLVGFSGVENNQAIDNLFRQANRDPRMGAIYTEYITKWNQLGGGLFVNFNDISTNSQWGSWGALESVNQTSSPKYDALIGLLNR